MGQDDEVRIEIGFDGGQGVHIVADQAQWEQLQAALNGSEHGWVTVTSRDDARYVIATHKAAYVRAATQSRSIGFRD